MAMQFDQNRHFDSLVDENSRVAYACMVTQLMNHWQLGTSDQLQMLGLNADSRATLSRYRKGAPLAKNRDLIERVAYMLDIHAQLRLIFPHNRNLVYGWMTARVGEFENMTPVEVVKEYGIIGLNMLRHYLEKISESQESIRKCR